MSNTLRQQQTTSDTATHDNGHSNKAANDEETVKHDEQRTVDDNGDTVRQRHNTAKHRAAKHGTVVKNQHWAGKWAVAEKRSTDFYGYS